MPEGAGAVLKIVGIALIVVGAGLGYWGYDTSNSLGTKISETITGSHSDEVMRLYIGGAVCLVVGVYLFFRK